MSAKKMTAVSERTSTTFKVDEIYEFEAPKYYDFASNMKDSGSLMDELSDHDNEWFEISHSPSVVGSSIVTPRRPVKLVSSPRSVVKPPSSSDVVTKSSSKSTPSGFTISDGLSNLPSPMTNGAGLELENCDDLLKELGLSPMPKGYFDKRPKKKTPLAVKVDSHKPSPLRKQVEATNRTDHQKDSRNSLYRRLFDMKPKSSLDQHKIPIVPAKLKVGADMLPSRSVKPLTVPCAFKFATDERMKRPAITKPNSSILSNHINAKPTEFRAKKQPTIPNSPKFSHRNPRQTITKTIQTNLPIDMTAKSKVTIPVEPKFATGQRLKSKQFASNKMEEPKIPPRTTTSKVTTIPRSPKLMTTVIRRPPTSISTAQSFVASPFKARPAPKIGKPFEPIRPHNHTKPKEIKFPGDQLSLAKRQRFAEKLEKEVELAKKVAEMHISVYASPRKSTIRKIAKENIPKSNAIVRERKFTVPQSPKFSTGSRLRVRSSQQPSHN